jgi:proline dehydrogenase
MGMNRALQTWAWNVLRPVIDRASRSYVAGADLASALRVGRDFQRQGFGSTVCFWDGPGDASELIAAQYLSIIDALGSTKTDTYVSVKAPALRYSLDLFRQILNRARSQQLMIHFDALGPETAAPTFSLIRDLGPRDGSVGCTLPGRWRRSVTDAELAAELGLRVRVVKGQWHDPEEPKRDPRAGFLEVIDKLAGSAACVAVATHDPQLAREALRRLRDCSTPCELELLFGLPVRQMILVVNDFPVNDFAVPVRYYIPYGHAWLPYALGQMKKNPMMAWWLVRDLCRGSTKPSALRAAHPLSSRSPFF